MGEPAPTLGAGSHTTVRICPTVSRHCIKLLLSRSAGYGLLRVGVHTLIVWSHTHPIGHTHPTGHTLSYQSHTHPVGHTPILLVTYPPHMVTHPSYWSHTHPPAHTPILLVTHPSYWAHTHLTGRTPILLAAHPSYLPHTNPTGHTLFY